MVERRMRDGLANIFHEFLNMTHYELDTRDVDSTLAAQILDFCCEVNPGLPAVLAYNTYLQARRWTYMNERVA